jgi:TetR/AcrR family transcriptional regulator, transcriptional repressor of bet genes
MTDRRPYRRETEERRRDDLISAALDLVAEGGPRAATVRAISDKAGVTAGLIRHYFASKEELTRAAYTRLMSRMTAQSAAVLETAPEDAVTRLSLFIAAAVSPPVLDAEAVGLWAGFVQELRRDEDMREVHSSTYLAFRNLLQSLIAALPAPPADPRRAAIAINGLIDGLWMEGSLLPEAFSCHEIIDITLQASGAILGVDLTVEQRKERSET